MNEFSTNAEKINFDDKFPLILPDEQLTSNILSQPVQPIPPPSQKSTSFGGQLQHQQQSGAGRAVKQPVPILESNSREDISPSHIISQPNQYPPLSGMPFQNPQAYYVAPEPTGGQQQQQQQQQQQSNILFAPEAPVIPNQPSQKGYRSFLLPIIVSCLVVWLFGFLFGIIAFIFAMLGQRSAAGGDDARAKEFAKVSYGVSLAGIIVGFIVIAIVGGSIIARKSSCIYGHFMHDGHEICCSSVTCPYGTHIDSNGCPQCCDQFSRADCFKNGYFKDEHGCKMCCGSIGSCEYGAYNDSYGCKKCCGYFSISQCSQFGYRLDSKGCKTCCDSFTNTNCLCYDVECSQGFYNNSNGCKACCSPIYSYTCQFAYNTYNDSNGCKQCCNRINIPFCSQYGYKLDSRGCRVCCNVDTTANCSCYDAVCSHGSYNNTSGCKTCCAPTYHCYNGYYFDTNGCKKCCDSLSSRQNITCTMTGRYDYY